MPFGTPITIREAIARIDRRESVLPGIQRELVWTPDQITRLFDSLLRGYPIGSFLFWTVERDSVTRYQFYEFIRHYSTRDAFRNPKFTPDPSRGLTAILDGQQRLSALYIGLKGSYSERRRYARRGAQASYAKRRLYLNLARPSSHDDREFDFRFLEHEDDMVRDGENVWFRVGKILHYKEAPQIFDMLIEEGLVSDKFPTRCLVELHRSIMDRPLINFFIEEEQDLDRVLNIFIRVNSGGTPLSYSDLLLSIATAQWEHRDAREDIHSLVDELKSEFDLSLSRDFVLKCCLMLADLDLRWKVENFTRANMLTIEARWESIAASIRLGARLLRALGFSDATLTSANAVIPVIYYLHLRGNPATYAEAASEREDRERVKRWLHIVLLKRTFSGVPDSVLRLLRDIIRSSPRVFPLESIEERFSRTPNSLTFQRGELEGLLDEKYGSPYAFSILALLYPDLDYANQFHLDHLHPRAAFSDSRLRDAGIPSEHWVAYRAAMDAIPNLQLLQGQRNIEKADAALAKWLDEQFPSEASRREYARRNFLPEASPAFSNFLAFVDSRKELLLRELEDLVGGATPELEQEEEHIGEPPSSFHMACIRRVESALGVSLEAESRSCFAGQSGAVRVVCVVSKPYNRGGRDRFWYAFSPAQADFVRSGQRGYVAFGLGNPDTTALVPATDFIPLLDGMRMTEKDGGRNRHWHVEFTGAREELQLSLPVRGERISSNKWLLTEGPR